MEHIIEILNCIIPGIIACAYIYVLNDSWRISKSAVKKSIIAVSVSFASASWIILYLLGITSLSKFIVSVIGMGVGMGAFFCMAEYRDARMLFICCSGISFNLVGTVIAEVIGSEDTLKRLLIKFIVYIILFFFIYRYFRKPVKLLIVEMEKGWGMLSLVPVSFSVLCLSIISTGEIYYNSDFKLAALVVTIAVCCCYVSFYQTFSTLQEQYKMKSNYTLFEAQMDHLKKQVESVEAVNKQMRIFKHDIRHYTAIQTACLEEGDIENAKKILSSMENTLDKIEEKTPRYTNSFFMNAVISNYARKAEEDGIEFTAQIVMPRVVEVEYVELAVVISNALENAWNECRSIPEGEKRVIRLTGAEKGGQYFMEIYNTCQNDVVFDDNNKPQSREAGHGYGTQSITAFAEKHNSLVEFKKEGKEFRVRLILS